MSPVSPSVADQERARATVERMKEPRALTFLSRAPETMRRSHFDENVEPIARTKPGSPVIDASDSSLLPRGIAARLRCVRWRQARQASKTRRKCVRAFAPPIARQTRKHSFA